jgi:hypothetical protein
MITTDTIETKAEQRIYAMGMLQKCVHALQEQGAVDRQLLQDAANWAVVAEALRRRS